MLACDESPWNPPDAAACAAQTFATHLEVIQSVIAFVARRHRLSADEAEEFASIAYLKLIDRDYAILRKFGGRSTLRTYLTTVVQRLLLDHRVSLWGKWRPSARARQAGPAAVMLERLTGREGLSLDEARARIAPADLDQACKLEQMFERLPRRTARRFVDDGVLCDAIAPTPGPDAVVDTASRITTARRTGRVLQDTLSRLSPEDRLILRLRFVENVKISEIARRVPALAQNRPKALYMRLRRLLDRLGASLEAAGIARTEVLDLIGAPVGPDIPRAFPSITFPAVDRVSRVASPLHRAAALARQPNVNANVSTPASRNSISNRRSRIGLGCRIS